MKYFLKVPEDEQGQHIYRPEEYQIESGEEVEVDKATYDAHHDRDVFESSTDSKEKSADTEAEGGE